MPHWTSDNPKNFGPSINLVNSIDFAQLSRGWLPRRSRAFIIERPVGQKRSARRPEDSSHDSRRAHGDRDHFTPFALRAFEQAKDWKTISCIVGPHGDLQNARLGCGHALVDLFEVGRKTDEIVIGTNNLAPIRSFIRMTRVLLNQIKLEVFQAVLSGGTQRCPKLRTLI